MVNRKSIREQVKGKQDDQEMHKKKERRKQKSPGATVNASPRNKFNDEELLPAGHDDSRLVRYPNCPLLPVSPPHIHITSPNNELYILLLVETATTSVSHAFWNYHLC